MKIKSFFKDLMGAFKVKDAREKEINNASKELEVSDPINETAKLLHPSSVSLKLIDVKKINDETKTFVFTSNHIPYFEAGQYLSLKIKIGNTLTSRPYSISSAPYQALGKEPIVEITIQEKKNDSFVSTHLLNEANIGDSFLAEMGLGDFHYNPIIDSKNVVAIAGGSGITPFLSMAREIKYGDLDINLTILHGSRCRQNILLVKELNDCLCDKVKVIDVLSDDPDSEAEKGYISRDIIKKYSQDDSTYFVCGPDKMYSFVREELKEMNILSKRIHFETNSCEKLTKDGNTYEIKVIQGENVEIIKADSKESIATSLERACLKIHTKCRSGVCGACRIKVIKGQYYIASKIDNRRATDKEMNYVYSCSTFPLSDMTIKINID